MTPRASLSLAGRTLRWTFPGGPTGDTIYEHRFNADGTVEWRDVATAEPPEGAKPQDDKKIRYESFEVGPGLHLASYLSNSGHTLTVLVNLNDGALHGFASNEKAWYPLVGRLQPPS